MNILELNPKISDFYIHHKDNGEWKIFDNDKQDFKTIQSPEYYKIRDLEDNLARVNNEYNNVVKAHDISIEFLQLEHHRMRVLGYAQALAWKDDGQSWNHLCEFSKACYISTAEHDLAFLDGNNPNANS